MVKGEQITALILELHMYSTTKHIKNLTDPQYIGSIKTLPDVVSVNNTLRRAFTIIGNGLVGITEEYSPKLTPFVDVEYHPFSLCAELNPKALQQNLQTLYRYRDVISSDLLPFNKEM